MYALVCWKSCHRRFCKTYRQIEMPWWQMPLWVSMRERDEFSRLLESCTARQASPKLMALMRTWIPYWSTVIHLPVANTLWLQHTATAAYFPKTNSKNQENQISKISHCLVKKPPFVYRLVWDNAPWGLKTSSFQCIRKQWPDRPYLAACEEQRLLIQILS